MRAQSNMPHFLEEFNTSEKCMQYLCKLKWGNGFVCKKCNHTESIVGRDWYYRRCRNCKRDESCFALTLFHKLKFPVTTAFLIVHQLSTSKKGVSCCEISRQHNITLKTAWFFRRKVQQAMIDGKMESFNKLFEKSIRDEGAGSHEVKKVQVTIQCSMENPRKAEIVAIKTNISQNVDQKWNKALWTPISSGKSKRRKSKQGFKLSVKIARADNNNETKLYIYRLRNWLAGIHHLVSLAHLQKYLQEFQYRYDYRKSLETNPKEMLQKFVELGWLPYKYAKAN